MATLEDNLGNESDDEIDFSNMEFDVVDECGTDEEYIDDEDIEQAGESVLKDGENNPDGNGDDTKENTSESKSTTKSSCENSEKSSDINSDPRSSIKGRTSEGRPLSNERHSSRSRSVQSRSSHDSRTSRDSNKKSENKRTPGKGKGQTDAQRIQHHSSSGGTKGNDNVRESAKSRSVQTRSSHRIQTSHDSLKKSENSERIDKKKEEKDTQKCKLLSPSGGSKRDGNTRQSGYKTKVGKGLTSSPQMSPSNKGKKSNTGKSDKVMDRKSQTGKSKVQNRKDRKSTEVKGQKGTSARTDIRTLESMSEFVLLNTCEVSDDDEEDDGIEIQVDDSLMDEMATRHSSVSGMVLVDNFQSDMNMDEKTETELVVVEQLLIQGQRKEMKERGDNQSRKENSPNTPANKNSKSSTTTENLIPDELDMISDDEEPDVSEKSLSKEKREEDKLPKNPKVIESEKLLHSEKEEERTSDMKEKSIDVPAISNERENIVDDCEMFAENEVENLVESSEFIEVDSLQENNYEIDSMSKDTKAAAESSSADNPEKESPVCESDKDSIIANESKEGNGQNYSLDPCDSLSRENITETLSVENSSLKDESLNQEHPLHRSEEAMNQDHSDNQSMNQGHTVDHSDESKTKIQDLTNQADENICKPEQSMEDSDEIMRGSHESMNMEQCKVNISSDSLSAQELSHQEPLTQEENLTNKDPVGEAGESLLIQSSTDVDTNSGSIEKNNLEQIEVGTQNVNICDDFDLTGVKESEEVVNISSDSEENDESESACIIPNEEVNIHMENVGDNGALVDVKDDRQDLDSVDSVLIDRDMIDSDAIVEIPQEGSDIIKTEDEDIRDDKNKEIHEIDQNVTQIEITDGDNDENMKSAYKELQNNVKLESHTGMDIKTSDENDDNVEEDIDDEIVDEVGDIDEIEKFLEEFMNEPGKGNYFEEIASDDDKVDKYDEDTDDYDVDDIIEVEFDDEDDRKVDEEETSNVDEEKTKVNDITDIAIVYDHVGDTNEYVSRIGEETSIVVKDIKVEIESNNELGTVGEHMTNIDKHMKGVDKEDDTKDTETKMEDVDEHKDVIHKDRSSDEKTTGTVDDAETKMKEIDETVGEHLESFDNTGLIHEERCGFSADRTLKDTDKKEIIAEHTENIDEGMGRPDKETGGDVEGTEIKMGDFITVEEKKKSIDEDMGRSDEEKGDAVEDAGTKMEDIGGIDTVGKQIGNTYKDVKRTDINVDSFTKNKDVNKSDNDEATVLDEHVDNVDVDGDLEELTDTEDENGFDKMMDDLEDIDSSEEEKDDLEDIDSSEDDIDGLEDIDSSEEDNDLEDIESSEEDNDLEDIDSSEEDNDLEDIEISKKGNDLQSVKVSKEDHDPENMEISKEDNGGNEEETENIDEVIEVKEIDESREDDSRNMHMDTDENVDDKDVGEIDEDAGNTDEVTEVKGNDENMDDLENTHMDSDGNVDDEDVGDIDEDAFFAMMESEGLVDGNDSLVMVDEVGDVDNSEFIEAAGEKEKITTHDDNSPVETSPVQTDKNTGHGPNGTGKKSESHKGHKRSKENRTSQSSEKSQEDKTKDSLKTTREGRQESSHSSALSRGSGRSKRDGSSKDRISESQVSSSAGRKHQIQDLWPLEEIITQDVELFDIDDFDDEDRPAPVVLPEEEEQIDNKKWGRKGLYYGLDTIGKVLRLPMKISPVYPEDLEYAEELLQMVEKFTMVSVNQMGEMYLDASESDIKPFLMIHLLAKFLFDRPHVTLEAPKLVLFLVEVKRTKLVKKKAPGAKKKSLLWLLSGMMICTRIS